MWGNGRPADAGCWGLCIGAWERGVTGGEKGWRGVERQVILQALIAGGYALGEMGTGAGGAGAGVG